MKRTAKRNIYLMIGLLLSANILAQDTVQVITTWLKQNAIPVKYIESGNQFSDLQPLKKTLKDAVVVGLGEATHGTHEFFTMSHRLIEFLVREMNFSAVVLESSYSACRPINDYVLYGKGDRAAVLTGQGYTAWDFVEFSAMLDWLRAYNQTVEDDRKIRFYGMDLCYNGLGRERVLTYLKKYGPERIASADSLFQLLSSEEEKWPTRLDQAKLQESYSSLHQLISYFDTNKDRLIDASSAGEWEMVYHDLKVMEYWLLANLKDPPSSLTSKKLGRDDYMGQILLYIIDNAKPGTKFIIVSHNDHVINDPVDNRVGHQLKQRFGDKYYALALNCYQGTYQSRIVLPDGYWAALKIDTIPPLEKTINWYLHGTNIERFFIDLRSGLPDAIVEKWQETSQKFNNGRWRDRASDANYNYLVLKGSFDGILFIEQSTPAHPTRNTLERTSKKIGF